VYFVRKSTMKDRQLARNSRAERVRASIEAAVRCPLCPEVTAEVGVEALTKALEVEDYRRGWKITKTARERAERLTGDPGWRERALGWIDAFRHSHRHGPTWRQFGTEPSLWPADTTGSVVITVLRELSRDGYLDGTKTPFGLRHTPPQNSPGARTAECVT
jgi:pterin-4a-carbinolamine dehydratase